MKWEIDMDESDMEKRPEHYRGVIRELKRIFGPGETPQNRWRGIRNLIFVTLMLPVLAVVIVYYNYLEWMEAEE